MSAKNERLKYRTDVFENKQKLFGVKPSSMLSNHSLKIKAGGIGTLILK